MESLKKVLGLLQQHWEKVALGVALATLALAGVLLAKRRSEEEQKLTTYEMDLKKKPVVKYTRIDWAPFQAALQHGTNPIGLDLKTPRLHYIFSPVKWQRNANGEMLKVEMGNEIGAEAVRVTKIAPYYLTVAMDRSSAGGFFLGVTREGMVNPGMRKKSSVYLSPGGKEKDMTGTFWLREAKGTNDDAILTIELADTNEKATVTKEKPFRRVDGYAADMSYPPDSKVFPGLRANASLTVANENYTVASITQTEVVLAGANGKRTTLRYNPAP
jgi:hypothetical protein